MPPTPRDLDTALAHDAGETRTLALEHTTGLWAGWVYYVDSQGVTRTLVYTEAEYPSERHALAAVTRLEQRYLDAAEARAV